MVIMYLINFQRKSRNTYKKNLNTIVLLIDYDKDIMEQIEKQLDITENSNALMINNASYSLILEENIFSNERTTMNFYSKIVNHQTLNLIKENIKKVSNFRDFKEINSLTEPEIDDLLDSNNLVKTNNAYFTITKVPYVEKDIKEEFYIGNFKEIGIEDIFINLFKQNRDNEKQYLRALTLAEFFLTLKQSKNIFFNYNKEITIKEYRSIFVNSLFS
ncbi:hypothetical protein CPT_Machias_280 [Staphylococcus phage Machias]|nr:hypothetical protein CPT_Machias_280 [Staphylococcus phage Machias]